MTDRRAAVIADLANRTAALPPEIWTQILLLANIGWSRADVALSRKARSSAYRGH